MHAVNNRSSFIYIAIPGMKQSQDLNTPELYRRRIRDEWRGHFDMLNDQSRNRAYARWVEDLSRCNDSDSNVDNDKPPALWCDIGTGSGFLGCLVASKGAHCKVVSFEAVPELARIARETLYRSNCSENNVVWLTHTTELDSSFMEMNFKRRAQFIVSELLDTSLLGEGLVEGMRHARECLLVQEAATGVVSSAAQVIPRYGRVLVQAWSGPLLRGLGSIRSSQLRRHLGMVTPAAVLNCSGPPSGYTIHAAPLLCGAVPVSEAVEIFKFDFLHLDDDYTRSVSEDGTVFDKVTKNPTEKLVKLRCICDSKKVDAYILWWDCGMDCSFDRTIEGSVFISTSPLGHSRSPPPDHWRQCVYFRDQTTEMVRSYGDEWILTCCSDESDVWILDTSQSLSVEYRNSFITTEESSSCEVARPSRSHQVCTCGLHFITNCFRFRYLNSELFHDRLQRVGSHISELLVPLSLPDRFNFVVIGDSPILASYAAKQLQRALRDSLAQAPSSISTMKCVNLYFATSVDVAARCIKDFCDAANILFEDILGIYQLKLCFYSMNDSDDNQKVITSNSIHNLIDECKDSSLIVLSEPYFASIQCEWLLEHVLLLWQTISSFNVPIQLLTAKKVEIFMCLFSSVELWRHYRAEVSVVEGIDVTAMNKLLELYENDQPRIVDSVSLHQWGARLIGAPSILGSFELSALEVDEGAPSDIWQGIGTISLPFSIDDLNITKCGADTYNGSKVPFDNKIHGIVFWAVVFDDDGILMDSSPFSVDSGIQTQAICCFDEPYCFHLDSSSGILPLENNNDSGELDEHFHAIRDGIKRRKLSGEPFATMVKDVDLLLKGTIDRNFEFSVQMLTT